MKEPKLQCRRYSDDISVICRDCWVVSVYENFGELQITLEANAPLKFFYFVRFSGETSADWVGVWNVSTRRSGSCQKWGHFWDPRFRHCIATNNMATVENMLMMLMIYRSCRWLSQLAVLLSQTVHRVSVFQTCSACPSPRLLPFLSLFPATSLSLPNFSIFSLSFPLFPSLGNYSDAD